MKHIPLAALTLAALTSTAFSADLIVEPGIVEMPAAEAAAISGDIELYAGGLSLVDSDDRYSFTGYLFGGAGRVNLWLGQDMSAQFDLSGELLNGGDPQGYSTDYSVLNGAAHLNYRTSDILLGVFGSAGLMNDGELPGNYVTIGAEALATVDNLQFYGQIGRTAGLGDASDVTALYAHGEVRYFVDPNLMLSASGGVGKVDYSSDDTINALRWGAKVEYRFEDSPMSIFAAYQGNHQTEPDEDEAWTTHALMAGVKFSFGSDSLEDAAKSGPTLRDYNPITGYEHLRYADWE